MAVNQLKAGAALNYVVLGLSNLVGLLYTPYMLRMMGQSEYGLYSLVASVIAYLTIMDFGFGNAIIRYTAKFRAEGKLQEQYSMFGMFLILYSIIGVIAFLVGLGLYFNIDSLFGDTMTDYELGRARILMLIMIINLAFTFPLGIFGSIVTAYEDFVFQKVVQIVRIILNTVVMICLLKMGYRAVAMVVVQTIFNLGTLLLNYFYCRYKIHIKILFGKFQWGFLKEVAIYSFWIFLNAIMDRIYWSTGQFILGTTSGTITVAIFSVAIQLELMYMSFSTAISGVLLPRITAMVTSNNSYKEISDLFIRTGRIQYIILIFIFSGFIIFGQQFITLWAGENYREAFYITILLFIPSTISLSQNLGITILQARNQMRFRSLLYVSIAAISLIGQILLAKRYGAIGCSIAISIALIVGHILIMNVYYHKKQKIDMIQYWKEILKASIVPAIFILLFEFIINLDFIDSIWELTIGILIYSILYIPIFWKFGMNQYEKNLILDPIKQLTIHNR